VNGTIAVPVRLTITEESSGSLEAIVSIALFLSAGAAGLKATSTRQLPPAATVNGVAPHVPFSVMNMVLSAPLRSREVTVSGAVPALPMVIFCFCGDTVPTATAPKLIAWGVTVIRAPETGAGIALSAVVPSPSWPAELPPQVQRAPDAFRAAVWPPPAPATTQFSATVIKRMGVAWGTGLSGSGSLELLPSWPLVLFPHDQRVPSAWRATE
jgi:hypothetical protein